MARCIGLAAAYLRLVRCFYNASPASGMHSCCLRCLLWAAAPRLLVRRTRDRLRRLRWRTPSGQAGSALHTSPTESIASSASWRSIFSRTALFAFGHRWSRGLSPAVGTSAAASSNSLSAARSTAGSYRWATSPEHTLVHSRATVGMSSRGPAYHVTCAPKTSNQAMQLTASKSSIHASRVCHHASILRSMHRGLAAADLGLVRSLRCGSC